MKAINTKAVIPIFSGILIILLSATGISAEKGNIHMGSIEVRPFISIEETYDDNIFRESRDNENDDWINKVRAGIGIFMPLVPERGKDLNIKAGYQGCMFNYAEYSDENRIDHGGEATADLNLANDIFIRLNEQYTRTADPATSEITQFRRRHRNIASALLGREKKYFGLEIGYRNIRDEYDSGDNLDKYENRLNAGILFFMLPKTAISIEYTTGFIKYKENTTNSDSMYHEGGLAVKGRIAPKTTGIIKTGYRQLKYEEEEKADFLGITAFANITYKLKDRFIVNLYGEREPVESTFLTNSYFESNKGGLKIDIRFVYKFHLALDGFFQYNRYPDKIIAGLDSEKRRDKLYGGNASLRFEVKDMIAVKFNYGFTSRNSNFNFFDYKNNQYTGSIYLTF
jgi:hypothetical protein